jgi:hypothetical protein
MASDLDSGVGNRRGRQDEVQTMKGILLRWLARYDGWCQEWGLTPENRRCCAPVRYDEDEQEEPTSEGDVTSLNQNCASRPR